MSPLELYDGLNNLLSLYKGREINELTRYIRSSSRDNL
jgi:hypothetical protein